MTTTAVPTKPVIRASHQPLLKNMSRESLSRLMAGLGGKAFTDGLTPAEDRLGDHAVAAFLR